ncbi:acyl carrier protein [Clostridium tertium]|uniref:acyl carrier protein n=1 Tax=Clostridium tertium TaxID=1559 RepID=UPI0024B368B3|nr:phosphopantetheine-binding protein [Clostridium tertium]MDI9216425.1 phosphopantetheine-binding protein [Clostridium tertium]
MRNIEFKVREIIANCIETSKKIDDIRKEENLLSLGMDSLNCIKVIVSIESEFGFEFEDEDLNFENFHSVQSIVSYIERRYQCVI